MLSSNWLSYLVLRIIAFAKRRHLSSRLIKRTRLIPTPWYYGKVISNLLYFAKPNRPNASDENPLGSSRR